ncbi:MAG: class I SAM-dependent methyltransferase [Promethearchaeota archaeon]
MATILMTLAETKAPNKYEWSINLLTLGRRGRIYDYLKQKYLQESQLLLDAGCGTGRFMEVADTSWITSIGIDVSEGMLQEAQKRFIGKKHDHSLIQASITSLPVKSEVFDVVICNLVLSELNYQQVQDSINEFIFCLKKGGLLLIVTESVPKSKFKRSIINIARVPAFMIASLISKTPKHPIHDIMTPLSRWGSIIDQKTYLGGYLTLFAIKKNDNK